MEIKDKVQRWFRLGSERLEKELNIVKIIGDLRDLRLLSKDARKADNAKYRMQVMGKNVLDLDTVESELDDQDVPSIANEGRRLEKIMPLPQARRRQVD